MALMRPHIRLLLTVLAAVLMMGSVFAVPAPARTTTRSSRSSRVDPTRASDQELDQAVQGINTQVTKEEARVDTARGALTAAITQEQAADQRLADTETRLAAMRVAVMSRA